jgi:hypothetical protein
MFDLVVLFPPDKMHLVVHSLGRFGVSFAGGILDNRWILLHLSGTGRDISRPHPLEPC